MVLWCMLVCKDKPIHASKEGGCQRCPLYWNTARTRISHQNATHWIRSFWKDVRPAETYFCMRTVPKSRVVFAKRHCFQKKERVAVEMAQQFKGSCCSWGRQECDSQRSYHLAHNRLCVYPGPGRTDPNFWPLQSLALTQEDMSMRAHTYTHTNKCACPPPLLNIS